ncbi:MAG: PqqD family protein [Bacteroidaceae bacterium]|nr:PqqD family protein [Bacteroidaceae bacterium]
MRINPNFKLREIAGETIVVNQGMTDVNMTRIISLNATAKLLYETMSGKYFQLEDAAMALVENYGIDKKQALEDAAKWVEALTSCGVIEE